MIQLNDKLRNFIHLIEKIVQTVVILILRKDLIFTFI